MLENDPLGPEATEARRWLTIWWIEVPDLSVSACGELLGSVTGSKKKYAPELVTQMMFSSGAFVIENVDRAQDDLAMYQTGIEGSLRAYEAVRKSHSKAK